MSWPKAHQMESTVSRYWWDAGTNSAWVVSIHAVTLAPLIRDVPRKTAESTGRLPPTPMLHTAASEQSATYPGEPPAAVAKTPVMKSVMLNAHLTQASESLLW